jgi:pyrroloquinoline quinone biosynthesis protein E
VTLNVVLHRHNLEHLEQIIALARAWDVDRLELAHAQYTGWAFRNRAALLPSPTQVDRAQGVVDQARRESSRPEILHVLPDYFQDYPKSCLHGWGRAFLTVAPDGAILPCQTAREIPGLEFPNVRTSSLEQAWFHAPVFARFRGTSWMPEPCRSCARREIDFGGCRCQAFLLTGDPAVTDPVCHLSPLHSLIVAARNELAGGADDLLYRHY